MTRPPTLLCSGLFLGQVFRDDEDRDDKCACLLQLIGYSLMSHARHEKFVMLLGPGGNGKSVLLAILEALGRAGERGRCCAVQI